MFKLDDNFLTELGLSSLPPAEKNKMLSHIYETLEMKIGMRLAEKMSNEQLDEFESFINGNDEAGALKWLESNFPNYKQVVAEELEKLKTEIKQVAPQIIAQAASATAPGFPAATPGSQPFQQQPPQFNSPAQQHSPSSAPGGSPTPMGGGANSLQQQQLSPHSNSQHVPQQPHSPQPPSSFAAPPMSPAAAGSPTQFPPHPAAAPMGPIANTQQSQFGGAQRPAAAPQPMQQFASPRPSAPPAGPQAHPASVPYPTPPINNGGFHPQQSYEPPHTNNLPNANNGNSHHAPSAVPRPAVFDAAVMPDATQMPFSNSPQPPSNGFPPAQHNSAPGGPALHIQSPNNAGTGMPGPMNSQGGNIPSANKPPAPSLNPTPPDQSAPNQGANGIYQAPPAEPYQPPKY